MKHLFIINPAAGKRDRSEEYSEQIRRVCTERGLDFEIACSQKQGDCREIARRAAESGGEVRLYACGGDGTLNEVDNGAAGFDNAAVTHFPCGSGNDMIKMFDQTEPFFHLERLLDCDEAYFDLIRCNGVYAINILSMGLDARVGTEIAKYKRLPLVTGSGAYVISLIVNLLKGLSQRFVIHMDGRPLADGRHTLVCVCNGRWYGGGYNPVPEAEPDDGLLDVLVVKKVGLLKASSLLGRYQVGRYAELPDYITHYQCRSLTIGCDRRSVVNIDGEAIFTTQAEIEIVPHAIRFFYPKGLHYESGKTEN